MTTRTPAIFLRSVKGRLYGTAAAATESSEGAHVVKQPARVTKLENGLTVASIENCSPVSQVSLLINAGSRFESRNDLGLCHFLRKATSLSAQHTSNISLVRSVEQTGTSFGCTGTREYLMYNMEGLRNEIYNGGTAALKEIVLNPAFKTWEIEFGPIRKNLNIDLADLKAQPQVQIMEMIHQAAFRDTLGRSLYAPSHFVNKYNQEQLMSYHNTYFSLDRMALVGLGVNHDDLVAEGRTYSQKRPEGVSPSVEKAMYHGGELRNLCDDSMTHAAIVTEGPSLTSKDLFAVCVLQQIMGSGPFIKYSENSVSKLGQGVAEALSNPFAVSCISANYTDSGLFGFYLCTQPGDIEKGLKAAMNTFANVTKNGVSDEDVVRGKNQLKAAIAINMECSDNIVSDLAEQAIGSNKITSTEDMLKAIDAIQTSDVANVAKRIINGKPSMASLGDLQNVPYLDQLSK